MGLAVGLDDGCDDGSEVGANLNDEYMQLFSVDATRKLPSLLDAVPVNLITKRAL